MYRCNKDKCRNRPFYTLESYLSHTEKYHGFGST